jgi:hypothetical protein
MIAALRTTMTPRSLQKNFALRRYFITALESISRQELFPVAILLP